MAPHHFHHGLLALVALLTCFQPQTADAQTPEEAQRAFENYRELADAAFEAEIVAPDGFLNLWTLPERERDEALAHISSGKVFVRRLERGPEGSSKIDGGEIHHWIGTAFLPGVDLERVLALAKNYDDYTRVFAPDVVASRVLVQRGPDDLRVYLRLRKTKVITFVYDSEHEVRYTHPAAGRAYSIAWTPSIRQVDDAGTTKERQRAEGDSMLLKILTYWRYAEADGGVYIENESLILTRKLGFPANLVIGGMVRASPREGVATALRALRRELVTP